MSKYWTTRDGKVIRIKGMETSHIINSLRMLERNAPLIKARKTIREENDIETLILFQEMDDILFLRSFTSYADLEDEYNRR